MINWFQLTNQASEKGTTVFSLQPQPPPTQFISKPVSVTAFLINVCLAHKNETPLETKQAFPLLAAQAELLRPDAACKDAGPRQVSPVCPN